MVGKEGRGRLVGKEWIFRIFRMIGMIKRVSCMDALMPDDK